MTIHEKNPMLLLNKKPIHRRLYNQYVSVEQKTIFKQGGNGNMKNIGMAKRFTAIVLAFVLLAGLWNPYDLMGYQFAGLKEVRAAEVATYYISTKTELLAAFERDLRSDRSQENTSYILTKDIDMAGTIWNAARAIGLTRGSFDGRGYKIKNLTGGTSFFNELTNSTIKNVTFENVNLTFEAPIVYDNVYYGSISGRMSDSSKMINCHVVSGSLTMQRGNDVSTLGFEHAPIGGLVGRATNSGIYYSSNAAAISIMGLSKYSANSRYTGGGIVGDIENSDITGCYNTGDLTTVNRNIPLGGISGSLYDSGNYGSYGILGCYNTGNISTNYGGAIIGAAPSSMQTVKVNNCVGRGSGTMCYSVKLADGSGNNTLYSSYTSDERDYFCDWVASLINLAVDWPVVDGVSYRYTNDPNRTINNGYPYMSEVKQGCVPKEGTNADTLFWNIMNDPVYLGLWGDLVYSITGASSDSMRLYRGVDMEKSLAAGNSIKAALQASCVKAGDGNYNSYVNMLDSKASTDSSLADILGQTGKTYTTLYKNSSDNRKFILGFYDFEFYNIQNELEYSTKDIKEGDPLPDDVTYSISSTATGEINNLYAENASSLAAIVSKGINYTETQTQSSSKTTSRFTENSNTLGGSASATVELSAQIKTPIASSSQTVSSTVEVNYSHVWTCTEGQENTTSVSTEKNVEQTYNFEATVPAHAKAVVESNDSVTSVTIPYTGKLGVRYKVMVFTINGGTTGFYSFGYDKNNTITDALSNIQERIDKKNIPGYDRDGINWNTVLAKPAFQGVLEKLKKYIPCSLTAGTFSYSTEGKTFRLRDFMPMYNLDTLKVTDQNGTSVKSVLMNDKTKYDLDQLKINAVNRSSVNYYGFNQDKDGSWKVLTNDGEESIAYVNNNGELVSTAAGETTLVYETKNMPNVEGNGTIGSLRSNTVSVTIDPTSIRVELNANGGSVIPGSIVFAMDSATYGDNGTLPIPEYAGHKFLGWYTSATGGTRVTESSAFSKSQTTLYAHWAVSTSKVTFLDYNGTLLKEETVNYDMSAVPPSNPFRKGYTFNGWDASYLNVKQDTTIRATYLANHYTLVYNKNGGKGTLMVNSTHIYDQEFNLAICSYIRKGFEWDGWNTKADGTGIDYANGSLTKNLTDVKDGTAILYAQWSQIIEEIAASQSTVVVASSETTSEICNKLGALTITGTLAEQDSEDSQSANLYSRQNLGEALGDNITLSDISQTSKGVSPKVSLANSSKNWKVNGNLATGTFESPQGMVFKGKQRKITIEVKLNRVATKTFTVTFDSQGGSKVSSLAIENNKNIGTLPTPTKAGYSFLGWYTKKTGGQKISSTHKITARITFYARWKLMKPSKPVSFKAKALSKNSIQLSWKKVTGATGYVIQRSTSKKSGFKTIKTIAKGTTVKYTNNKLKSNTTYYYKIRAVNKRSPSSLASAYTTPKSARTMK